VYSDADEGGQTRIFLDFRLLYHGYVPAEMGSLAAISFIESKSPAEAGL
jgi:hypothetical protein